MTVLDRGPPVESARSSTVRVDMAGSDRLRRLGATMNGDAIGTSS